MIKLTIIMKRRNGRIEEFEKLNCAAEKLIKEILDLMMDIPDSLIQRMRKAGIRGGVAGARLRKIIRRRICLKK